jgi:hypothetical protein
MSDEPKSPSADPSRGLYGQRSSRSADASRRLEFERLARMSAFQRVLLALELKHRARLLGPESSKQAGG